MKTNGSSNQRPKRTLLGFTLHIVLRAAGESLHAFLFLILWSLGSVEYLAASWGRWIVGPLSISIPLLYRIIRRRDGPVMLYANSIMVLYDCPIWIGGLLYIGRLAPIWLPSIGMLILGLTIGRWVGRIRAAAWAWILAAVFGTIVLAIYRTSESEWARDCGWERAKAGGIVGQLDRRIHPYDVDVDPTGRYLFVAYGDAGPGGLILRRDLLGGSVHEQKTMKGVQRIDFSPDGATLLTTPWGRQGRVRHKSWSHGRTCLEAEGAYLIPTHEEVDQLDPCGWPAGPHFLQMRGISNAFAAVEEPGGDVLAIAEMSKDVLRLDGKGREISRARLPGLNLYDLELALKGRRLVVSDQQWPWARLVDLSGPGLVPAGKIYVGPFSFGLLADPDRPEIVYLAGSLRNEVDALDVEAKRRLWSVDVGYGPRDLSIDRGRRILLAGNYFDGTVSLIDIETREEIARPFFGRLLRGVCYSPLDDRIYAATACGVRWASMEQILSAGNN